jgi:uncharacterized protein involved in exopolysaccharide biosynthesis
VRSSGPLVYGEGVSPLSVLALLLQHWRALVAASTVGGILLVGPTLVRGRPYVARASFVPQASQSALGQLAGLATQLGLPVAATPTSRESPDFYAELLRSRELLRQVVLANYRVPADRGSSDTVSGTLLELWQISAASPADQMDEAISRLLQDVGISVSLRTGIVSIQTESRSPALALQLTQRLLDLVDRYNRERRQSQATAERRFIQERLEEARQALARAEAEVTAFFEHNRRYEDSPELTFQAARLQRQVDLHQQVYTTLAQAYERARIDEVRDTPVVTVVDPPDVFAGRRRLIRKGLVGLVLGFGFGIMVVAVSAFWDRQRERNPEDVVLLRARAREAWQEIKALGQRR